MKIDPSKTLGCAVILLTVGIPLALFFGPFLHYELEGDAARKILRTWTKEDCATVWRAAKSLSAKYPGGKVVDDAELPEPMIRAGFRSAEVNAAKFFSRRGGSSHGSNGGYVICYFKGEQSEDLMTHSGGIYVPTDDEGR